MAAAASPSPFTTLLRRSKFASFDPAISQTYTTHGGDAHRGNWGLKRPLPLRRRQAYITVKSVDSPEQQTEWNNGESQVRFIRRWEELGVDARYSETSAWSKRVGSQNMGEWHVDSEFAPVVEGSGVGERWVGEGTSAVRNIHSMSSKEFARYLEKLRKLRPAFKAFVKKLAEEDPLLRGKSLYEIAQDRQLDYHKRFITSHAFEQYNSMESRNMQQVPHRTGGLSYSHTSPLETLFTTKPQPGFVLQKNADRGRRGYGHPEESYIVSFAGLIAQLRRRNAGGRTPLLDLASQEGVNLQQVSNSITNMRVLTHPRLTLGPTVVGRVREGVKGARFDVEVTSEDKSDFGRSNPYPPGSREYSSLQPQQEKRSGRVKPMTLMKVSPEGFTKTQLMTTLRTCIGNHKDEVL